MKRNVPGFLILLLACYPCLAFGQQAASEGKLFIIGGGDKPPEMMARMIRESGLDQGGYGVILPMSSSTPDTSAYFAKLLFAQAGIQNIYGLDCNKETANSKVKADSIRFARLVYISGGDQSRFMDIAAGSAIEEAIHYAYAHGAMIAGTSAGAAMMSEIMITGNQIKSPEYTATFSVIESGNLETRPGLGLIKEVIIDQHFLVRSRHNRLITAILEFPDRIGIGIDEATAILVEGKRAEVVGLSQVLVYKNSGKKMKSKNEKLSAEHIRLDIYIPGDSFSVRK